MLMALKIAHFALIDELYLEFGPGLTILTGETGAGKSIIIDAVNVILGNRTSVEMIRTGCVHALVEATFSLNRENQACQVLTDMGIELDEDYCVVVSRKLTVNGKNSCFINGQSASLSMVKRLGEYLVDVHGQHDHQSLLRAEQHRIFLDTYGGKALLEQRAKVADLYCRYKETKQELELLCSQQQEKARRLDMLNFQCSEIASAKLQLGEESVLREQYTLLFNASKLTKHARLAYDYLYAGHDRSTSVLEGLGLAIKELSDLTAVDPRLSSMVCSMETASYQLEEVAREIVRYVENNQDDPEKLQQVQDRLHLLHTLLHKYGHNVEEILAYYHKIDQERVMLENSEERQQQIVGQLHQLGAKLEQECRQLTALRQKAGHLLSETVCSHLRDLEMKNSQFAVQLTARQEYSVHGNDQVEFMFNANQGEPLKPLVRVASGGEMSRVALALKTALTAVDNVPTLVFDEVDAGVGGRTAVSLADKMQSIAILHQVLCVTHLPQVACTADDHLLITKEERNGKTITRLQTLDEQQRINEIIRMMGSNRDSATARVHAVEMLKSRKQMPMLSR